MFAVLESLPGIDVVESVSHARHVHGGESAKIHQATFNVVTRDRRPHTFAVRTLQMLRGHCRATTWDSRQALTVTGYEILDWDNGDPIAKATTSVNLPARPDLYSITVEFQGVRAYQACDRFAFAATLVIDGKTVEVEVELRVTRFEPLRR